MKQLMKPTINKAVSMRAKRRAWTSRSPGGFSNLTMEGINQWVEVKWNAGLKTFILILQKVICLATSTRPCYCMTNLKSRIQRAYLICSIRQTNGGSLTNRVNGGYDTAKLELEALRPWGPGLEIRQKCNEILLASCCTRVLAANVLIEEIHTYMSSRYEIYQHQLRPRVCRPDISETPWCATRDGRFDGVFKLARRSRFSTLKRHLNRKL